MMWRAIFLGKLKNKSLKDIAEESPRRRPHCFDYDGVYDDMKQKAIQPQVQDRQDRMGVKQVLVKLWAKGSALSVEGEEPIKQPLISAPKVLDTTGARDTFTAAFVVALVEGKSRNESLKFSAAAASLCVQVKGALPSMPDRKSVLALLQSH